MPETQAAAPEAKGDYLARAEVQAFIDEMVGKHAFDRGELERLLADAKPQQRVLDLMTRPAEAKPWHQYRPIFLTQRRINEGARFWEEHQTELLRAQETFGVDAEVVVAIIGVETFYGRNQGGFPVLDSLVTLGFDYPPRAAFFRSELGQFLLLTREEGFDPREVKGSYAGAMGRGQFISSSYRNYAVDFDGDGRRDLRNSWPDAIGSVANYLRQHGWAQLAPVVTPARAGGDGHKALLGRGYKPELGYDELTAAGIVPNVPVDRNGRYSLIELETESGPAQWLGHGNFYVITRYNRSPLYAMAVHQLSQEIRRARDVALARPN
ncbi:MAG: lytic murein transglycosylase B [Chromatiales bacterium]|nr:lytic murein transglycosylase B [Chromatiales bacterium]MDX9767979.1 lytic murein transglycosylase B [Ectothiorhodospiraceae bacterium]